MSLLFRVFRVPNREGMICSTLCLFDSMFIWGKVEGSPASTPEPGTFYKLRMNTMFGLSVFVSGSV